ncbi:MAG: transglycosylase SLT domain-containing protein, partial [Bryobacteraceae bacterium]
SQDDFDAGKRFYIQGDMDAARTQFNSAVDVLLTAPGDIQDRGKLESKLDELVDKIYRYDLDGFGSGETQDAVVYERPPLDGMLEMTFPTDPKLKPKVKEEIQATVSQLPLEENDAVLGFIHYFSSERGHKTLVAGLRRAGLYSPMIHRILAQEGVPQELIYLAQIESGFYTRAVSNKSCVGLWQFGAARGREYGLNQTAFTDDRLDPEKATRAAAKHLKDLYNHFGDWYLAMAAYDCGPGCIDRAVQRTGFADFWELRSRNVLVKETMNYVPVVLAVTIMAKNPKDYGLEDVQPDSPIEYDTIRLTAATNLNLISDASDRPVSDLRDLNPSLLRTIAPAGFDLRVPKGTLPQVASALEAVPAAYRASWRMHRIEPGETLAAIAKHFHTGAGSILAANRSLSASLEPGDVLVIPAAYKPERTARVHHGRRSVSASARHSKKTTRHYVAANHAGANHVAASHKSRSRHAINHTPRHTARNTVHHAQGSYRVASVGTHHSSRDE